MRAVQVRIDAAVAAVSRSRRRAGHTFTRRWVTLADPSQALLQALRADRHLELRPAPEPLAPAEPEKNPGKDPEKTTKPATQQGRGGTPKAPRKGSRK